MFFSNLTCYGEICMLFFISQFLPRLSKPANKKKLMMLNERLLWLQNYHLIA